MWLYFFIEKAYKLLCSKNQIFHILFTEADLLSIAYGQ